MSSTTQLQHVPTSGAAAGSITDIHTATGGWYRPDEEAVSVPEEARFLHRLRRTLSIAFLNRVQLNDFNSLDQ